MGSQQASEEKKATQSIFHTPTQSRTSPHFILVQPHFTHPTSLTALLDVLRLSSPPRVCSRLESLRLSVCLPFVCSESAAARALPTKQAGCS